jgi:hypothetical protein
MTRGRLGSALIRPNSKIRLLLPLSALHLFYFFLPFFLPFFFSLRAPPPLPLPFFLLPRQPLLPAPPAQNEHKGSVDDAKHSQALQASAGAAPRARQNLPA